ncbi:MAG TPA: hypothetical protein PLZ50_09560, partial [Rubrivivax sp.]|nr:hypothetical protein [Rubrivivax sp.]
MIESSTHGFGDGPAMGIEWRDAMADGELVVLISKLLELVDPAFPERGELDLGAPAGSHAVCLRSLGCAS